MFIHGLAVCPHIRQNEEAYEGSGLQVHLQRELQSPVEPNRNGVQQGQIEVQSTTSIEAYGLNPG